MILFFSLKKKLAVSGKVTLQSSMELINYQPAKGGFEHLSVIVTSANTNSAILSRRWSI